MNTQPTKTEVKKVKEDDKFEYWSIGDNGTIQIPKLILNAVREETLATYQRDETTDYHAGYKQGKFDAEMDLLQREWGVEETKELTEIIIDLISEVDPEDLFSRIKYEIDSVFSFRYAQTRLTALAEGEAKGRRWGGDVAKAVENIKEDALEMEGKCYKTLGLLDKSERSKAREVAIDDFVSDVTLTLQKLLTTKQAECDRRVEEVYRMGYTDGATGVEREDLQAINHQK